ncbi:D-alanyl-D-alanine carboxypeptidase/D-alanyl-D-alanine-endopeptidase [Engelhardtia mirabilis]|uniref:D-alanyl-D-alanine carboxypeptidase DacC n=1 Tax=Engelhardtia mirabilis TaxID=2528011 RepID=A0A518BKG0_9BACT|nr:D-alanyl-D-alanine carboxypeptidase DacC precursor [Planctomycetes bacterium Pla133]QDV01790.1 D-alanyl-D-alanine carboxypeptidase DacC precursor [Planctomycetes bacterium Pla86]
MQAVRRCGAVDWRLTAAFIGGVVFAVVLGLGFDGLTPNEPVGATDRARLEVGAAEQLSQSGTGPLSPDDLAIDDGADGTPGGGGDAPDDLLPGRQTRGRWTPAREAIDPRLQALLDREADGALDSVAKASGGKAGRSDCLVSFLAVDLESGAVVASRAPDRSMAPASNLKLVTTLSALHVLGPDWRFRTPVEAAGPLNAGVLGGDLVVRAGGDPLFRDGDPDYARGRLAQLAGSLAEAGLRRVDGALVLDLGSFAPVGPAPGWPTSSASWTGSYGYVAGLTANAGLVDIAFEALAGGRTQTTIAPSPTGLREESNVASTSQTVNDVQIGLYDSSGRLVLKGELGPPGRSFERDIRHPNPPALFAALFLRALADRGIDVRDGFREARGVAPGRELAALETPWIDLITPINQDSVNPVADAVFLAMGGATSGQWTREAARSAVAGALTDLGIDPRGLHQVGGSGLSRDNRISPRMVVELLRAALAQPPSVRQRFLDSLAVAGQSGTLEDRMGGTAASGRLRGKTGFIQGASALSGYVETLGGRQLVFSIVVEYPRLGGLNNSVWKPMHDSIGAHLAQWSP